MNRPNCAVYGMRDTLSLTSILNVQYLSEILLEVVFRLNGVDIEV